MAKEKRQDLEATLALIENTIDKLDEEQLSVEDSLSAFESGLKLIRKAQKELQEAEQRVATLIEEDGDPSPQPFLDEPTE